MSRCCAINCPSETTIVDLSVSDDHGKEWPIGRICAVHEAMVEGGFMFYALRESDGVRVLVVPGTKAREE